MKRIFYTLIYLGLFIYSCKSPIDKELITKKEYPAIIIRQVNIFNGRDSVLIYNQDVLIENGIIKQIADRIENASEAFEINAQGKTLMPGLIDSHVHLSGSGSVPWDNYSANEEYNLAAYLYAGITTIYDLGGLANSLNSLSEKIVNGKMLGPDIFHTHIPITIKDSHPIPLTEIVLPWPLKGLVNTISPTIDQIDEATKLMEKYVSNDVDYVKISCDQIPEGSPEMSFEQMKALIEEAHKHNKKAFVHIGSPENAVNAVNAGADVLAHGVWRGKLSPNQADLIADSKIPIIYTLAGFNNIRDIYSGNFIPSELDRNLVDKKILDPVSAENGRDVQKQAVMNTFFRNAHEQSENWKENFKLLNDRDAVIVIGTDSNLPGTYAGSTYFQEMELLKEYGMSNFEILKSATYLNSKLFLDHPDFGMVAQGKKANLLLINGNPLLDLELLKRPELILKNGDVILRKD